MDSDSDGIPNVWEVSQALNININDSALDKDGDGYTNIEEYINGPVGTDSPSPTPVPGDVNGDNRVTLSDLSTLLSNFGKTGTRSQGNVAGTDSAINLLDLSTLLANFGR